MSEWAFKWIRRSSPRITHFVTASSVFTDLSPRSLSVPSPPDTPPLTTKTKKLFKTRQRRANISPRLAGWLWDVLDIVRMLLLNPYDVAQARRSTPHFDPRVLTKGTKGNRSRGSQSWRQCHASNAEKNRNLSKQECSQWWFWQLKHTVLWSGCAPAAEEQSKWLQRTTGMLQSPRSPCRYLETNINHNIW